MTNPDALRIASNPSMSTDVIGVADIMEMVHATLEEHRERYRTPTLPPLRDVTIGDPARIVKLPMVAIVPSHGTREEGGCTRRADGLDVYILRLYAERVEKTQSDNATLEVARHIDYLRALFYEQGSPLVHPDNGKTAYKAWPSRWAIADFIEEDRSTGRERSRIRGAVIELDVWLTERIAQIGD